MGLNFKTSNHVHCIALYRNLANALCIVFEFRHYCYVQIKGIFSFFLLADFLEHPLILILIYIQMSEEKMTLLSGVSRLSVYLSLSHPTKRGVTFH